MRHGTLVTSAVLLAACVGSASCGSSSEKTTNAGLTGIAGSSNPGSGGSGDASPETGGSGSSVSGGPGSGSPGSGGFVSGGSAAGSAGQTAVVIQNGVTVAPTTGHATFGGKIQFNALVNGLADKTVAWTVDEGTSGGAVTDTGVYTAPTTAGTYHVVATSNGDTSLKASAAVVVVDGAALPALKVGVWTDITPPGLNLKCCPGTGGNGYGLPQFAIDASDPRKIIVCIDTMGLWKTNNGGTSWELMGKDDPNHYTDDTTTYIDSPIAIKIDPNNSNHLYATQGVRGKALGFWVSTDGGANWTKPAGFKAIAKDTTNDVTWLTVDPSDFKHVIVGSHAAWPGKSNAGFIESKDGGSTWVAHQPMPSWSGGSMGIHFLYSPKLGIGNSSTLLVSTDGDGFWKTTDDGANWKQVAKDISVPHGGNEIYYASNGWIYAGAAGWPARSHDNGDTWEHLKDNGIPSGTYYSVHGDGTTLYTSISYTGDNAKGMPLPYSVSPESDGKTWTTMPGGQTFTDGPFMQRFDSANNILYSANWDAGFLALKVR